MLRFQNIKGPLIMALFPLQKYDIPKKTIESTETPMERIKKIFVAPEYETTSKEIRSVISFTTTAGVIGMLVGGLLHTQDSVEKFIDTNQATRFFSHYDAKRELQLSVISQFAKGAIKFGWKVALFSAIFESVQVLLTTYRGEFSILHYIVAGSTTGFLFKISLGLKGSLVGMIVGGILGAFGGSLNLLLLNLTGLSLEQLQNLEQTWSHSGNTLIKEKIAKNIKDELKRSVSLNDESNKTKVQLPTQEENVTNTK